MFFGVGPIFMGVPPLTNNTAITSGGKDLVKIRPAVAEQSRQKIKKTTTERVVQHKTPKATSNNFRNHPARIIYNDRLD